eukprot:TRINITY_DN479_c0_g1_i1.p1 TRINITY_DN479_c0_g1~~TRINITY_DN479_c0_g1_i1.p1  ORF type:complete len:885 (+),score=198.68 TRINITY_DN479_c0_g1_i1:192-2846(+)
MANSFCCCHDGIGNSVSLLLPNTRSSRSSNFVFKVKSNLENGQASTANGITTTVRRSSTKRNGQVLSKFVPSPYEDEPETVKSLPKLKGIEGNLRSKIMEDLMKCAVEGDYRGAIDCFHDLTAAGLMPGPRSFHGLVVAHTLAFDVQGAVQSLRKEIASGLIPLEETFIALNRLLGSKGKILRGEEVLGAMEDLNLDISKAWLVLIEQLFKNGYHKQANEVFLKGAKGGLRAPDKIYDLLIEENCKLGDHSNAIEIAENMEFYGRMATTFHYNCLLSVQAASGIPEIAMSTFEDMYYGEEYMKPNTESYNWVFQALVRDTSQDRLLDVVDFLGQMIEDHQRVQPDARTYALLVECLTKYCITSEAMRHFRALSTYPNGMELLHNDGKHGDPLSLYLRMLCLDGRTVDLLEALEAMAKYNQPITSRAMIVDRKGRTLVSSWIEPLQQEADLGFEVDYMERYISEGGLTGNRRRWLPRRDLDHHTDPDSEGFFYTCPAETSFKERCRLNLQQHYTRLLKRLKGMGVNALGGNATKADVANAMVALRNKAAVVIDIDERKPKAAYKMTVSELRAELAGQDLPTDGTKQVLYQRVMKARKANKAEGRPLWVPPVSLGEPELVKEDEKLVAQLEANLANDNSEYYRKRFLQLIEEADRQDVQDSLPHAQLSDTKHEELMLNANSITDVENDEDGEEYGDDEDEDNKDGKDADAEDADAEDTEKEPEDIQGKEKFEFYSDLSIPQKCKFMATQKRFDMPDMYRIEDAWGWRWENERRARVPERWTQEKEVELAIKVMDKVIELGGKPTIGDCAMILRAAIRAPLPSAMITILRKSNDLGYVFGSPLYDEVITLCVDLDEMDAAIAIVSDLESAGINVSNETLDKILHRQS